MAEIVKENMFDEKLGEVVRMYRNGWPKGKKQAPENIRHHWKLKDVSRWTKV